MRNFILSLALFFAFVGQPWSVAANEFVSPIRSNVGELERPPQKQKSESRKRSPERRKRSQPAVSDTLAGASRQVVSPMPDGQRTTDSAGRARSAEAPADSLVVEEERVEVMPTFRGGGVEKFRRWVTGKIKYPEELLEEGIGGLVEVTFVIEPDGKLAQIEAVEFTHVKLLHAVVDALEKSPRWKPGTLNGKPVPVRFTLPLEFHIPAFVPVAPDWKTKGYRF